MCIPVNKSHAIILAIYGKSIWLSSSNVTYLGSYSSKKEFKGITEAEIKDIFRIFGNQVYFYIEVDINSIK